MLPVILQWLKPIRGIPLWLRYVCTTGIVFACFGMRWAMQGVDDSGHLPLFLMFVPAVIVASFLFDRGSGFLAVALSSVIGIYFFVEPENTFALNHAGEIIRLGTFIIIGLLTASIIEALRTAVDDLAHRTAELDTERQALAQNHALSRQVDEQKSILLSDLNHRVKNHLQAIIGMISVSSRRAVTDFDARAVLEATSARLQVLGRVYDRLQLRDTSATVDARGFVAALCADLKATVFDLPVSLKVDVDAMDLDSGRAVSLGLVINELVTNALKYAFPEGREGEICVSLKRNGEQLQLTVSDTGIGMVEPREGGTGKRLVNALARQLGGHAIWTVDGGTRAEITFPADESSLQVY
jgi:two-component system, sensor histidine kinase PdtaS